jgi:hypothetical protein
VKALAVDRHRAFDADDTLTIASSRRSRNGWPAAEGGSVCAGSFTGARADRDAADHEAVGVRVVEDALAFAEQALDQVAIAQLRVRNLLHHRGMGGVIGLGKHG